MSEQASPEKRTAEMSAQEVPEPSPKKTKPNYPCPVGSSTGGQPLAQNSFEKKVVTGKFFDSGEYELAKLKLDGLSKVAFKKASGPLNWYSTGKTIPTPENVPKRKTPVSTRRTPIQPSKFKPNDN